jgi:hypothetical protein
MLSKEAQARVKRLKVAADGRVRHLVDDPTYTGGGEAPQISRSDAMRRLAAEGLSINQISAFYEVPYQTAYVAVRLRSVGTTTGGADIKPRAGMGPSVPSKGALHEMSKAQLMRIVNTKQPKADDPLIEDKLARIQAAADELDRRYPGWIDA